MRQAPAFPTGTTPSVTDFVYRRQFAIEWGHCDPAGIVFNARFYEFFDRSTWLMFEAALGVPLQDLAKTYDIVGIPLVGAQAKFMAPAAFGDLAEMESRVLEHPAVELRRRASDVGQRHAGRRRPGNASMGRAASRRPAPDAGAGDPRRRDRKIQAAAKLRCYSPPAVVGTAGLRYD